MKRVGLVLISFVLVLAGASSAAAEGWVDFYVGAAIPSNQDVETKELGLTLTIKDVEFDTSLSFGGRLGWWIDSLPWLGVALDVFHFRPDVGRQTRTATLLGVSAPIDLDPLDISVTAIGLNLMARYGLSAGKEFPHGRTQLYVGGGPALFITKVEDKGNFDPSGQDETDTSFGFDVKAGIRFLLNKNWDIFTEYRFTRHSPELDFRDSGVAATLSTDLNVHHILAGVSFHFD